MNQIEPTCWPPVAMVPFWASVLIFLALAARYQFRCERVKSQAYVYAYVAGKVFNRKYDCRLHLTDLRQYDAELNCGSSAEPAALSAEEIELEKQLNEERYRDMVSDPAERLLFLEEEMKRYQASHGIRGVEFALDYSYESPAVLIRKPPLSDEEPSDDRDERKCIIAQELKVPVGVETVLIVYWFEFIVVIKNN
ncbi:unnamed protein product [Soboliphyme baturini]|uniref:DRY_EERY domain-containing protein n=1 Tax=Soboliphyme baturini TaxID=241478 RepID=A0A183I9M6_9BILA|nr:unnamed protein product [Soboliphyme baturini]